MASDLDCDNPDAIQKEVEFHYERSPDHFAQRLKAMQLLRNAAKQHENLVGEVTQLELMYTRFNKSFNSTKEHYRHTHSDPFEALDTASVLMPMTEQLSIRSRRTKTKIEDVKESIFEARDLFILEAYQKSCEVNSLTAA